MGRVFYKELPAEPIPRYPPYNVRTLHTGAPGLPCNTHMAFCGDIGGMNPDGAGTPRMSGPAVAAEVTNMQSKKRTGPERRHAGNATQTVFWRTYAQKVLENVIYFQHPEKVPK